MKESLMLIKQIGDAKIILEESVLKILFFVLGFIVSKFCCTYIAVNNVS
jgi:hypothetical protein